jgi:hypothetical protein
MRNSIFLTIIILSTCMSSCDLLGIIAPDDEMLKEKVDYKGTKIRLDGYYYSEDRINKNVYNAYYFFANGSCKIISLGYLTNYELHDTLPKLQWNYFNRNKTNNGAFWIKDSSSIEMQFWTADNISRRLYAQSVKIINDTVLVIHEIWRANTNYEPQELSDTFYFQKAIFKPDSLFFEKGLHKRREGQ